MLDGNVVKSEKANNSFENLIKVELDFLFGNDNYGIKLLKSSEFGEVCIGEKVNVLEHLKGEKQERLLWRLVLRDFKSLSNGNLRRGALYE